MSETETDTPMSQCIDQVIVMLRQKTDQNVVLGPVVSCPFDAEPKWYFIVGTGTGNDAHFDSLGAHTAELADDFRGAILSGLVQQLPPLVVHDTDDELVMVRICESLWPCPKVQKIRADIIAERKSQADRTGAVTKYKGLPPEALRTKWIDPQTTKADHNKYADPPFLYCPHLRCGDPVACGQSMACGATDGDDRADALRNGTFHEYPICLRQRP